MLSGHGGYTRWSWGIDLRIRHEDDAPCCCRYAEALLTLPERGCASARDLDGSIALHHACAHGNTWLVRLLTAAVDAHLINALNARGWTPLTLALYHGHRECTKALLEVHADPLECTPAAQQLAMSASEAALNLFLTLVHETKLEAKQKHALGLDTAIESSTSGSAGCLVRVRSATKKTHEAAPRSAAAGELDQLERLAAIATVARGGSLARTATAAAVKKVAGTFGSALFSSRARRAAQRRSDAEAERNPDEQIVELQDAHLRLAKQFVRPACAAETSLGDDGLSTATRAVDGEGFDFVYDALHALEMLGPANEQLAIDFTACRGGTQRIDRRWRTPVPSRLHARGGLYALRLPTNTRHVDSLYVASETVRAMPDYTARASYVYRPAIAGGAYAWFVVGDARAFDKLVTRLYRGELLCTKIMLIPALSQLAHDASFLEKCKSLRGGDTKAGTDGQVMEKGDGDGNDAERVDQPAIAALVCSAALVALVTLIAIHHLDGRVATYAIA